MRDKSIQVIGEQGGGDTFKYKMNERGQRRPAGAKVPEWTKRSPCVFTQTECLWRKELEIFRKPVYKMIF